MSKIALMIANGTEEMEAVIIADTLRRAKLHVDIVSISGDNVVCSRDVCIVADHDFETIDLSSYDVIILPGGVGGTEAFIANRALLAGLQAHQSAGKLLCAICAAPLALQAAGVLPGRNVTSHPSVSAKLTEANYTGARVERDGNILTSQGPGTAFEFSLEIIRILEGPDSAKSVSAGLVL